MAEQDVRSRELLTNELNKLNKKTIIDILVSKNVNDVNSEVIKSFFGKLLINKENSCEDDFKDASDNVSPSELQNESNNSLRNEITMLRSINFHLENRILDQCEIIKLMKTNNELSWNQAHVKKSYNADKQNIKTLTNVNEDDGADIGKSTETTDDRVRHRNRRPRKGPKELPAQSSHNMKDQRTANSTVVPNHNNNNNITYKNTGVLNTNVRNSNVSETFSSVLQKTNPIEVGSKTLLCACVPTSSVYN